MDGLEPKDNAGEAVIRDPAVGLRSEPIAPSLSPSSQPSAASGAAGLKKAKIFAADLPHGKDALAIEAALRPLAELAAHRDCEAPFTMALLGAAGSGKSFALAKLMAQVEAMSGSARDQGREDFPHPIGVLKLDAAALPGEPMAALAAALYDMLAKAFPDLAREAAHAVRDPHVVAREAAEELDVGRRRLDAERQNLAELEARRARLVETILFEQAGSQVDSYARANRARIESRLEGFGVTGDAIQNYKSMVRDIAESGGPAARIGAALRSFWAFKGQTRLLVTAAILVLFGLGCDVAIAHHEAWLAWVGSANKAMVPAATWSAAHVGWLQTVKEAAFGGAAVAVIANVWRGIRFLRPLFRGVRLLETEVADRRRDLDGLYAHQMRRVDALAADVELIGRRAAEADRRATDGGKGEQRSEPSPFAALAATSQAERFFAAVSNAMARGWRSGAPVSAAPLPHRIFVALDNVDGLPPARSFELLEATRRAFGHASFATVLAADPHRLAEALAPERGDSAALEQRIQIPFRLGAELKGSQYAELVEASLGLSANAERENPSAVTERPAPFDWSVSPEEASLLTALAPLAGRSPRAVKRYVNLYRIARSLTPADKGILAFMLALDQGGTAAEIALVEEALASGKPDAPFVLRESSPRLDSALASLWAGQSVTVGAAQRAAAAARIFSFRL